MRKFLIPLLLALVGTAHAAEDKDWGLISSLEGGLKLYGRYNSFERYEGAGSLVVRFVKNNNINFYIVGISDKDCDAGYGQLTFFDTNWKLIKRENYVQKGGNGTAAMGDLLCYLINKPKGQTL